jgi:hypothetical protein
MNGIDLKNLEDLQGKFVDDVIAGTGVEIENYIAYREGTKEVNEDDAEKLSMFFKVPKSFFLRQSQFIHHGKDNSYGPINNNYNYYFAKPETEEVIKSIISKKNQ